MISEIIEVPLPLAASRRLISFLTFQISIYTRRIAHRQLPNFFRNSSIFASRENKGAGCDTCTPTLLCAGHQKVVRRG